MTEHINGAVATLPAPADTTTQVDAAPVDLQERARQAFRDSVERGEALSGKALGELFERGERWGRDRIAEVKKDTDMTTVPRPRARMAAPKVTEPAGKIRDVAGETSRGKAVPAVQSSPEDASPQVAPGGRLVSWVGFVFGSIMSVAANVLHTWLPAAGMAPGWTPGIASQVGAAVWPIGLLLSVEVLSRVQWQTGFWWSLARYGGAGTVALGSAVISYGHLRDVLAAWGYGTLAAHVGPLVLDGLMVISGFALLAMSTHGKKKGAAA
ncbi:DUF2637 domain-containing protein [Lentzea rhizosphaerae]|uniref:DUF2637 domain-containing protein n=1 Tax=Lentzea rhizosphaerae TaxID=2041025 RepID=A0ABV8BT17_9PSEU